MALVVLAAASLHTDAAARLKIGFVYLGPISDLGWTYQHEVGRRAVVAAFGERVDTTYLENVPEGPDAERFIEQLAHRPSAHLRRLVRLHGSGHQGRGQIS